VGIVGSLRYVRKKICLSKPLVIDEVETQKMASICVVSFRA
jgi:hypothetical protein